MLSKQSVAQTAENYTQSSKMRRVLSRTQIQTGGKPGLGRFFFHVPGIYLPPCLPLWLAQTNPKACHTCFLQTYQKRPWLRHQTATQSPHTLNSSKPLKPLNKLAHENRASLSLSIYTTPVSPIHVPHCTRILPLSPWVKTPLCNRFPYIYIPL